MYSNVRSAALLACLLAVGVSAQTPEKPHVSPLGDAPALYAANCVGCHGDDLAGGRGPSLFADALLADRTDAQLIEAIQVGKADAGMPAFGQQLDSEQIARLVTFMRLRAGRLRGRPSFLPNPDGQVVQSEKQRFRIDVLASALNTPWGFVFLPDGRMLLTERPGRLRFLDRDGQLHPEPVRSAPEAWVRQDGGYFDIALHPDYAQNGWIYLSFSEVVPGYDRPIPETGKQDLPPSMTRIVRGRINAENEWVDQQDIYAAPAELYTSSVIHYGSRFLFDDEGHLFWTIGDRGVMEHAQDLSSPLGKIHRIFDDGSIPPDNPFVDTPGALPSIWTWGNRNPEGLAFDPATGLLWESEHGPVGGDEINIIEKGVNYGWGVVSMGLQPGITKQHQDGMEDPIAYYVPSIAPSGISFYNADRYPGWKGDLFVSALAGQKLLRFDIEGREIVHQETVFDGFGRVRDVTTGPDGLMYLLIQNSQRLANSPGMVIRLEPLPPAE